LFDITQEFGWVPHHNAVRGNVFGDNAARPYNGVLPNADVGENRGSGANRCSLLDYGLLDLPVGFGLQIPVGGSGPRIAVVDEHNAVADEDVILDRDAFADESVARDLAAFTDSCILLDLDKRANLRFIADLTTVQVDELGELDVSPKLHVRRDA